MLARACEGLTTDYAVHLPDSTSEDDEYGGSYIPANFRSRETPYY